MSPLRPHRKDTAKRLDQRSNPSAASPPRLTIFQHVLYAPEQRDNVKCFLPIWLYLCFSIKQTDPCLTAWAVRPILSGELLRRSKMSHKIAHSLPNIWAMVGNTACKTSKTYKVAGTGHPFLAVSELAR